MCDYEFYGSVQIVNAIYFMNPKIPPGFLSSRFGAEMQISIYIPLVDVPTFIIRFISFL